MFRHIRAVLFDLDGTLIDSTPHLGAAADKMRTDRGLPPLPLTQYRPMAGAGARGMCGEAFGISPDHPGYAALREEFFVNYGACLTQRTTIFTQVPELIDQLLCRTIAWVVITNTIAPVPGAVPGTNPGVRPGGGEHQGHHDAPCQATPRALAGSGSALEAVARTMH